jgi:hypothetical protein
MLNSKISRLYDELLHQVKTEGIYDQNTVDLLIQELSAIISAPRAGVSS